MSAANQPDPVSCTTIDLLRHGVCEGGEILRGSTDVELLPEGVGQMDAAVRQHLDWKRVISSPLKRCRAYAELIARRRNIALHIDERWREIDFGEWDGQEIAVIYRKHPKEARLFYSQPESFTPPAGEPLATAKDRVVAAFSESLELYRGERLLVIQHGGTARLLLTHILGMPLSHAIRIDVPYACLTRIRVYHEKDEIFPVLISHNAESAAHLTSFSILQGGRAVYDVPASRFRG